MGAFTFMHLKGSALLQTYWSKHSDGRGRVWGIIDDYCHDVTALPLFCGTASKVYSESGA